MVRNDGDEERSRAMRHRGAERGRQVAGGLQAWVQPYRGQEVAGARDDGGEWGEGWLQGAEAGEKKPG